MQFFQLGQITKEETPAETTLNVAGVSLCWSYFEFFFPKRILLLYFYFMVLYAVWFLNVKIALSVKWLQEIVWYFLEWS